MAGFPGLIGDGGRLLWDLLALNGRKSLWKIRGRRTPPPCQNPSDSGRARETGCDACQHLRQPSRLRLVCPLLIHTPAGWTCSVNAAEVRPFWGRGFLAYAALGIGLYLGGATVIFGGLRLLGYSPLGWWTVAWPGAWHRIPAAQSQRFLAQAGALLAERKYQEAQLALASAVATDPGNFSAGVLMAQIWYMQGNALAAEQTFERLARTHPEERPRLDLIQHDTLVAIGQGQMLGELALSRTRQDRERYAAWIEALLFGLRLSHTAGFFHSSRVTDLAGLAPAARRLVAAEALIENLKTTEARAALATPFEQPWNPIYARLQVEMLIRIGAFREVGPLLNTYGSLLGAIERELLRHELDRASGDAVSAQADLLGLLGENLTPAQLNRVCATLVRYPDRAAVERLHRKFGAVGAELPSETLAALWVTAHLTQAGEPAATWAQWLQRRNILLPTAPALDFGVTELGRPGGVPHLINTIPLPRPVVYALALRIQRR